MELTIAIDSVVRMREQQLWPYPDAGRFAVAAEGAGVDGILVSLNVTHVAVCDRDLREFDALSHARLCVALAPDSPLLGELVAAVAQRCVFVPFRRHEHSSGGSLAVGVVRGALESARSAAEGRGLELGARIDPNLEAIRICAEAGLQAVELNTASYALAAHGDSRARRIETLRECVSYARSRGLRVSVRGGLDFENAGALLDIEGIQEFRLGQALIAQALFDGIQTSVAKMRDLLGV
jgi:pyridoxine 5-phosphate synthase